MDLSSKQLVIMDEVATQLIHSRPSLQDYISGARDFGVALNMAKHVIGLLATSRDIDSVSRALLHCSTDNSYNTIDSDRNWVLEVLLQISGLSQTYVQERCSIHRLTHVVTGGITLNTVTAREIACVIVPSVPKKLPKPETVAEDLMRQRKYNLDTHSYGNPLYVSIRRMLERVLPKGYEITGYPEKNSVEFPSWHTALGGLGKREVGQIKVQFLLTSKQSGLRKMCALKVISAHEGHSADKRKEMAAKGRIMRLNRNQKGFTVRTDVFLGLLLDGEWEHEGQSMGSALDMVAGAGWSGVYDAESIEVLKKDLKLFFT